MATVLEVTQKSGNLKGTLVRKLKEPATTLQKVVEALAGCTAADEARQLQADNARLLREAENLKPSPPVAGPSCVAAWANVVTKRKRKGKKSSPSNAVAPLGRKL